MHRKPPLSLRARLVACALVAALAALVSPVPSSAQGAAEAASVAGLARYASFYADKTVVARGQLRDVSGRLAFEDGEGNRVAAVTRERERPDGSIDATGVLWDLGRMKPEDPRLIGYDLAAIVGGSGQEWPKPGDLYVFAVTRSVPADADRGVGPDQATVRSLVLEGARATGRQVTITGQFRGRNLFGDLPRSPGISRWDFVLRSAGAAVWVTGLQPRGKDFDFNPDQRIDSNRWLEVTGTVRDTEGLVCIQATKLALSKQPAVQTTDEAAQPKPIKPFAPPEVLFSIPSEGETDVSPTTTVRIQLSRALDKASLVDHMRVGYLGAAPGAPLIQAAAALEEQNDAPGGAVAVLVIRFAQPLERFRTVRIDLTDGIKATDGQPLKPWSLTFAVGG